MNAAIRLAICSLAAAVLSVSVFPAIAQEGAAGPPRTSPVPRPQPEVYRYGLGNPTVYRYAMPYICAYAPPGIAMRIGSILDRYASIGPMPQVPRVMPYAYSPHANQPIGHEKIWTSPNSYVYRPLYAAAPGAATAAVPEVIPTPPPVGSAIKEEPTLSAPQMPANEGLNGPYEF